MYTTPFMGRLGSLGPPLDFKVKKSWGFILEFSLEGEAQRKGCSLLTPPPPCPAPRQRNDVNEMYLPPPSSYYVTNK